MYKQYKWAVHFFPDSTQKTFGNTHRYLLIKTHSEGGDDIRREEESEEGGVARKAKEKHWRCVLHFVAKMVKDMLKREHLWNAIEGVCLSRQIDEEGVSMLRIGNVCEVKGAVCLVCASCPSYLKATASEDDADSHLKLEHHSSQSGQNTLGCNLILLL